MSVRLGGSERPWVAASLRKFFSLLPTPTARRGAARLFRRRRAAIFSAGDARSSLEGGLASPRGSRFRRSVRSSQGGVSGGLTSDRELTVAPPVGCALHVGSRSVPSSVQSSGASLSLPAPPSR